MIERNHRHMHFLKWVWDNPEIAVIVAAALGILIAVALGRLFPL